MGIINRLPRDVYDKIAAGEVVERPASVIKELVENSIDAGADKIVVEIQNGGTIFMRVADNGCGMSREDAELSFLRHATSKIKSADDLEAISTMGFRGEALASISAVAKVDLFTRKKGEESGTHVVCTGGEIEKVEDSGNPEGTTFIIKDLFYNVPARMKFLKKDATEAGHVANIMIRFILAHPEISFKLINNGKEQLFSSGDNMLLNSIYSVYGKNFAKSAIEFDETYEGVRIFGAVGRGDTARPNRDYQSCFINKRYVRSSLVFGAIEKAYKNQVMIGKYPMAIINIEINPAEIDINIHPTKLDVKFSDEQTVYRAIYRSIQNALYSTVNIPKIEAEDPQKEPERFIAPTREPERISTPTYTKKPEISFLREDAVSTVRPAPKRELDEYELEKSMDYFKKRQEEIIKENAPVAEKVVVYEKPEEPKQEALVFDVQEPAHQEEMIVENEPEIKVIGQVFDTYIIAQRGDEMLLIDQHAAHERLKYEKLKKDIEEHKVSSQAMLVPCVVSLNPLEYAAYCEYQAEIARLGFECEDFGDNSVVIRSTPYDIESGELENLLVEIIDNFSKNRAGLDGEKRDRLLYTIACKAAVKANHTLQKSEQESLVKQVLDFDNINTCPHGRPITISMSKKELEKLFKRIV